MLFHDGRRRGRGMAALLLCGGRLTLLVAEKVCGARVLQRRSTQLEIAWTGEAYKFEV